jgi:hypothetical protein
MMRKHLTQADGLRALFARPSATRLVIDLDSVAASQVDIVRNLARMFVQQGKCCAILDATSGKLARALGVALRFDLLQIESGAIGAQDAWVVHPDGFHLLAVKRSLQASHNSLGGIAIHNGLTLPNGSTPDLTLIAGDFSARSMMALPVGIDMLLPVCVDQNGLNATFQRIKVLAGRYGVKQFAMIYLPCSNTMMVADAFDALRERVGLELGVDIRLAAVLQQTYTKPGIRLRSTHELMWQAVGVQLLGAAH